MVTCQSHSPGAVSSKFQVYEIRSKMIFRNKVNPRVSSVVTCEYDTENNSNISRSVSVMKFFMRLFGLYFKNDDGNCCTGCRESKKCLGLGNTICKVYASCLMVVLWMNCLRMFTGFSKDDKLGSDLYWKILATIYTMICTCSHTVTYGSIRSGDLHRTLEKMCAFKGTHRHVFKATIVLCCYVWFVIAVNVGFVMYGFFGTSGRLSDLLVPIGKLIPDEDVNMPAIQSLFLIIFFLMNTSWLFPLALNFLLAMLLTKEFDYIGGKFEEAAGRHLNFEAFEELRLEHQSLCGVVRLADNYVSALNATNITGLLGILITVFFNLVWNPFNTVWLSSMSAFWLVEGSLCILMTAFSSVIVNQSVSL